MDDAVSLTVRLIDYANVLPMHVSLVGANGFFRIQCIRNLLGSGVVVLLHHTGFYCP